MSRRPLSPIAEDDAEPIAAIEDDEDEGADDAEDIPEIDADADDDAGPVIVHD